MIRPATAREAPTVAAIVDAAYRHYIARIGKPPGPMLDDYAALVAAGKVWVHDDGSGIGGIVVLEDQDGALLLDNVAVAPDRQGTGVGRALILFAEDTAKARGFDRVRLYTHAKMIENIALYLRIGFVEMYRTTEKGFDRVYMEKPLGL
jgi:GNAT superfamily N-acetyltransferase